MSRSSLSNRIASLIIRSGAVPFETFMAEALYDPAAGYYTRGELRTGKASDFITNISVGPLFGKLLAEQAYELWDAFGRPPKFALVEQGAHDGTLARDVVQHVAGLNPEFLEAVRYIIIEPFSANRHVQESMIRSAGVSDWVAWVGSVKELPPGSLKGMFFSNELVDSFPVARIRFHQGQWQEAYVGLGPEHEMFVWEWKPVRRRPLQQMIDRWNPPREEGYIVDFNLRARPWLGSVCGLMISGLILTIDYGYETEEFFAPARRDGSLRAYREQRVSYELLRDPGEQDLTAHIHFTELMETAAALGWSNLGLPDQHHAIVGMIGADFLCLKTKPDPRWIASLKTLMHPECLGTRFHWLVQGRGLPEGYVPAMVSKV